MHAVSLPPIEWLVSVDSTIGRSSGGLTSKIHLASDSRGRPPASVVTGGNTDDCTRFTTVMEAIRVHRIGPGRPRARPGEAAAPGARPPSTERSASTATSWNAAPTA